MKLQNVEYLIIGGGPGGTSTAMALAAAGKSVLLVEKGPGLGGTCLFEDCIPSKIFCEAALLVKTGLPIDAITSAIHPHSMLTESFVMAVRNTMAQAGEHVK